MTFTLPSIRGALCFPKPTSAGRLNVAPSHLAQYSERVSFMRIIATMFALVLIASPAASQNASTNHDQAALEFLEVIGMPKVLQQVSVAMAENLIRTNPTLAPQREVILAWSKQYITWEAAAPELTLIYKQA